MRPMLATQTKRKPRVRVGPDDHGRKMSLDDFDRATVVEGYVYELAQGVIEVSDIPSLEHGFQVEEARDQTTVYKLSSRDVITYVAGGAEMKVLVRSQGSERHPDVAVYTTPRPVVRGSDLWSLWIPTLVIEVVSESSRHRDYHDKPEEYLDLGVSEYWIIDAAKKCLVQHVRTGGIWRVATVKSPKKVASLFFPGLKFDLAKVIAAAKK